MAVPHGTLSFAQVLEGVKAGKLFARTGWNGVGMAIGLQVPGVPPVSGNTLPYLWFRTAQRQRVPWVASHTDLLSTDWYLTS